MPEINQREIKYSVVIPTFNRLNQLKILLDSIFEQNIDRNNYEVIVVNDGGTDGTSGYIKSFPAEFNIRLLEIENSGPSIARNKGAFIAAGDIIVFVDSDCTVPKDWLIKYSRKFEEVQTSAIGGASLNKVPENPSADVYDRMNHFFLARHNTDLNKSRFLMTNNLAVKRDIFLKYGGFDERFTIGAEDREFVCRLIAGGESVYFDKDNVVGHHHNFSTRSFLFHHYRFGRGSHLLLNVVKKEKNLDVEKLSFKDYCRLFSAIGAGEQFLKKINKKFLFFMSQIFIFLGYLSGKWEGIKDLREEKAETAATFTSGKKGTMVGMISFLGGNAISSVFSFLCFALIGRSLPLSEFGIFMFAFSSQTILSKVSDFGVTLSVSRYAAEHSKKGDEHSAGVIFKKGLSLILLFLFIISVVLFASSNYLNNNVFKIEISFQIMLAVWLGMIGSIVFDYLTAIYAVYLQYINLIVINNIVAVFRFLLVLVTYLFFSATAEFYFWIFIIPYWIGILFAAGPFFIMIKGKGDFSLRGVKEILNYGGWITLTGISRHVSRHIGSLLLATFSTQKEVGLFGLGLSLSIVYSVILSNVFSYFIPIGARLESDKDLLPFTFRTIRLTLPLVILCLLSIIIARPFIAHFYGAEKHGVYAIFVILSVPPIIRTLFIPLTIYFHYFFKPYYIASESFIMLSLYITFSIVFIQFGSLGVSNIIFITNMIGIFYLLTIVKIKFSKKNLILSGQ